MRHYPISKDLHFCSTMRLVPCLSNGIRHRVGRTMSSKSVTLSEPTEKHTDQISEQTASLLTKVTIPTDQT